MSFFTEKEAQGKACCKERPYNDKEGRFQTAVCLASDCMAWRWLYASATYGSRARRTDKGYCGLVGEPEYNL
jgi:hypothetical protein